MGVIWGEMSKLRHLGMIQDVDGKLEKKESETETAGDRNWSFDWVKTEGFYLFSPNSDTAYWEPRCSVLSNNAFLKMAWTPKSACNDRKQHFVEDPPPVLVVLTKTGGDIC